MMELKKLNNINELPNSQTLYQRLQSLATLDAIICEEWEMRYFSFNQHWDTNQAMASMRDGEGSHYFILFDENKNVVGKIFDKEIGNQEINQISDTKEFSYFLSEPAFINDDATWYFYHSAKNELWQVFPQQNNLSFLGLLVEPMDYVVWAEAYFEIEIKQEIVKEIVSYSPLTKDMVLMLNPNRNLNTLQEDLEEIGYPYDF